MGRRDDDGGIGGDSHDDGGGSGDGAADKRSRCLHHTASCKPLIACVVVDTRREGDKECGEWQAPKPLPSQMKKVTKITIAHLPS